MVINYNTKFSIIAYQLYDKLSKGVSILLFQLPYTLQLIQSYTIIKNSKAA